MLVGINVKELTTPMKQSCIHYLSVSDELYYFVELGATASVNTNDAMIVDGERIDTDWNIALGVSSDY